MKEIGPWFDSLPLEPLTALFAFLLLVLGVAIVASPGWGMIVMGAGILLYVFLPDQRSQS